MAHYSINDERVALQHLAPSNETVTMRGLAMLFYEKIDASPDT